MYRLTLIIVFIFLSIGCFSQKIKGFVLDSNNKPIINTNIYQPDTNIGTITNNKGEYYLELNPNKKQVIFQCIGFKSVAISIKDIDFSKELNVILEEEVVILPEFKVLANGEDPAYYIMRKMISMAPYYESQLSKYDCKVYLKGTYMVTDIPWLAEKMMDKRDKDEIKLGKAHVTESINEVHYEHPNKVTQNLIAVRSSDADEQTSPMSMVVNNLYNSDAYGVASPLGPQAFSTYKFKLMGSFIELGETIDKILVTPRGGKKKGVFSGYIYVIDNRWNLHSVDLSMKIPMMTMHMKQMYAFVENGVWMPNSFSFKAEASAMGFKGRGAYTASISDYKVTKNPNVDHSLLAKINGDVSEINKLLAKKSKSKVIAGKPLSRTQKKINELTAKDDLSNRDMRRLNRLVKKETQRREGPKPLEIKEAVKMSKLKIKNDSAFWAKSRPIKLTADETVSFVDKDSLEQIIHTPEYKDSVRNEQRDFKLKHIIWGKYYTYKKDSSRFSSSFDTPGLIVPTNLSFNTVDGVNLDLPFRYTLRDTMGRDFYASTKFNLAYERRAVSFKSYVTYMFNGLKRSVVQLSGGVYSEDYKGDAKESTMENMYYSLFAQKNFMKLYQREDFSLLYSTEIYNGLKLTAYVEYAKRKPLKNNSNLYFVGAKDRSYTNNIPVNSSIEDWQLEKSVKNTLGFNIEYTPRQFYRIRNNRKQNLYSKYPTFSFKYKKTLSVLDGDADYQYMELGIKQSLEVPFSNTLDYKIRVGKYLSAKKLFAQDVMYFRSSKEHISLSNDFTKFKSLGYYEPTSSDYFVDAHVKYSMDKFLLKRLPWFNDKMMMKESLYINYLHTENLKHYFEAAYGINNIFLLLDAEIVTGFREGEMDYLGLKFNIKLK